MADWIYHYLVDHETMEVLCESTDVILVTRDPWQVGCLACAYKLRCPPSVPSKDEAQRKTVEDADRRKHVHKAPGFDWHRAHEAHVDKTAARFKALYARTTQPVISVQWNDLPAWLCLLISARMGLYSDGVLCPERRENVIKEAVEMLRTLLEPVVGAAIDGLIKEGSVLVDAADRLSLPPQPAPQLKSSERYAIFKRDNYRCQICGVSAPEGGNIILNVDHIVPRAKGGTNDPDNLWTLCEECNRGKGISEL